MSQSGVWRGCGVTIDGGLHNFGFRAGEQGRLSYVFYDFYLTILPSTLKMET